MESEETNPHRPLETWERLQELVTDGSQKKLQQFIEELKPSELARGISRLSEADQTKLLVLLGPEDAADVLEELPEAQAVDMMEDLSETQAAKIVDEMWSDQQADFLNAMDSEDAESILREMDPDEAKDVRTLRAYPQNSAGGLMITEYVSYPQSSTIGSILKDIQNNAETYAHYDVLYAYIVTKTGKLMGVVQIRDLLLASPNKKVQDLMIRKPVSIQDMAPLTELEALFDRYDFFGIPVTDKYDRLVGVVRRSSVYEAAEGEAERNFLSASGIWGGEEIRSLPLLRRSWRRLSVLTINIGLNVLAASVIAYYQDTVRDVIALAALMPIISDMSGASGNQAIAVSIRELSLGLVKPKDYIAILKKELPLGLINGVCLGLILGAVAYIWKENIFLSSVVGGAMALNTLVSVALGGSIPLILKRYDFDPALASSPILTTVTDACGYFFSLSFATALMAYIVGA